MRVDFMRVSPEPNTGCWLWVGAVSDTGYGVARIRGVLMATHRIAWEETFGSIPTGLCVLHRCDMRSCVNPAHLFLGTKADNSLDMVQKRRNRFVVRIGASNNRTKLTAEQVRSIRSALLAGESRSRIAKAFGLSKSGVDSIARGESWKHLT